MNFTIYWIAQILLVIAFITYFYKCRDSEKVIKSLKISIDFLQKINSEQFETIDGLKEDKRKLHSDIDNLTIRNENLITTNNMLSSRLKDIKKIAEGDKNINELLDDMSSLTDFSLNQIP